MEKVISTIRAIKNRPHSNWIVASKIRTSRVPGGVRQTQLFDSQRAA
jgi:hypothetical protein